jgi:hypothetical protein
MVFLFYVRRVLARASSRESGDGNSFLLENRYGNLWLVETALSIFGFSINRFSTIFDRQLCESLGIFGECIELRSEYVKNSTV